MKALDVPEVLAIIFLTGGFIVSLFTYSNHALVAVCFLAGMLFGRIIYRYKHRNKTPIIIAILAFFLGFLLGSITLSWHLMASSIFLGTFTSYWLHEKGIVSSADLS